MCRVFIVIEVIVLKQVQLYCLIPDVYRVPTPRASPNRSIVLNRCNSIVLKHVQLYCSKTGAALLSHTGCLYYDVSWASLDKPLYKGRYDVRWASLGVVKEPDVYTMTWASLTKNRRYRSEHV